MLARVIIKWWSEFSGVTIKRCLPCVAISSCFCLYTENCGVLNHGEDGWQNKKISAAPWSNVWIHFWTKWMDGWFVSEPESSFILQCKILSAPTEFYWSVVWCPLLNIRCFSFFQIHIYIVVFRGVYSSIKLCMYSTLKHSKHLFRRTRRRAGSS